MAFLFCVLADDAICNLAKRHPMKLGSDSISNSIRKYIDVNKDERKNEQYGMNSSCVMSVRKKEVCCNCFPLC